MTGNEAHVVIAALADFELDESHENAGTAENVRERAADALEGGRKAPETEGYTGIAAVIAPATISTVVSHTENPVKIERRVSRPKNRKRTPPA